MRKIGLLWAVVGTVAMSIFFYVSADQAVARAQYKKQFEIKYPEVKANNKVTCNACHEGKSKKMRNEYGKALGKILDAKNVKDKEAIEKALVKTADENEKFAERLKAGKLPVE